MEAITGEGEGRVVSMPEDLFGSQCMAGHVMNQGAF